MCVVLKAVSEIEVMDKFKVFTELARIAPGLDRTHDTNLETQIQRKERGEDDGGRRQMSRGWCVCV